MLRFVHLLKFLGFGYTKFVLSLDLTMLFDLDLDFEALTELTGVGVLLFLFLRFFLWLNFIRSILA